MDWHSHQSLCELTKLLGYGFSFLTISCSRKAALDGYLNQLYTLYMKLTVTNNIICRQHSNSWKHHMNLPKQNLELFNVFSIIDLSLRLVSIGMKLLVVIVYKLPLLTRINPLMKNSIVRHLKHQASYYSLVRDCKLSASDGHPWQKIWILWIENLCMQLIWNLLYLVTWTHPNLCFAITYLPRFMHNCSLMHLKSFQTILLFLEHTSTYGLMYKWPQSNH